MKKFDPIDLASNVLSIRCPTCSKYWHNGYESKKSTQNPYTLNSKKYHHWKNGHRLRKFVEEYHSKKNSHYGNEPANDEIFSYQDTI